MARRSTGSTSRRRCPATRRSSPHSRRSAKSGHDADLRAFASNTLPTLKEHLQAAQSAEKAVSDEAAQSASSASGLEAAKKATGASHVAVEKQDRMLVPKTGM